MNEGYKSLGEIMAGEPSLKNLREMMKTQEVLDRFYEIFPQLAEHVIVVKLQKQTLTLAVENAVLRGDLKFHESDLISKINIFFKDERVAKIKFQA